MAEREILLEGLDDYLGLWEFVASVRDESDSDNAGEIRRRTLALVHGMLDEGLASPGFPTRDGHFDVVEMDAEDAIARISREWGELGREPDVGDIIWLRLTDKGRKAAREIDENGKK
jgi:hypothetical protein